MNATLSARNGHTELSEVDRMILAETEQDDQAFDFIATKLRLPSGGVNAFSSSDGDILKPPLVAVVAVSQKARAYWPTTGTGSAPLCSSPDGVNGWWPPEPDVDQVEAAMHARVKHPVIGHDDNRGPFACASCPLSQWGSAPDGGRGQACKALRRLVLLLDGFRMPTLLTLPPTSIRAWDAYCSGLASRGSSYFAVHTRLELDRARNDSGVDYAVVKLTVADRIEDKAQLAQVIEIRRRYAELVRQMDIEAAEYVKIDA